MQTRSARAERLVAAGLLEHAQITLGRGALAVTVSGYELTHAGRLAYCLCVMTQAEARARFRAVVERAMAKPLDELPYREPVKTRFHFKARRRVPRLPDGSADAHDRFVARQVAPDRAKGENMGYQGS